MSHNRRKNNDTVRVAAFAWWLVVFISLTGLGLSYVSIKNQSIAFAGQRGKLEKDLRSLNDRNRALRNEVDALTARSVLQRKVDSGFVNLVDIDPHLIVRLDPSGIASSMVATTSVPNKILAQK